MNETIEACWRERRMLGINQFKIENCSHHPGSDGDWENGISVAAIHEVDSLSSGALDGEVGTKAD